MASFNERDFLKAFYSDLLEDRGLGCSLSVKLRKGVTVNERKAEGEGAVWFLQNFNREAVTVELLEPYENAETGELNQGTITMEPFECRILIRTHSDTEKG